MGKPTAEEFYRRWMAASTYRNEHLGTWRLIYHYLFPFRSQSPEAALKATKTSWPRSRVREFGSRFVTGTTPLFQQWLRYQVGDQVGARDRPALQKEVDKTNAVLWNRLGRRSNWTTRYGMLINEAGCGVGAILMENGPPGRGFNIEVESVTEMAFEVDPWGHDSGIWRERERTARQISMRWPRASLPKRVREALDGQDETTTFLTLEGVVRDTSVLNEEVWYLIDLLRVQGEKQEELEILNDDAAPVKGEGSCPWTVIRWETSPENPSWGFGPIYDILPEVMAAQGLRGDSMAYAQLATRGMWQYDDDGTINARNVKLRPGTILPINPNSNGLRPVALPGQPDIEFFNQREFKENVDRALYLDRLGATQGTPMSATEVIERQAELGRVVGLPYGRIIEGMDQMVSRMHFLMKQSGDIKGVSEEAQPEFLGPFARAQRLEEALAIREGVMMLQQTVGDPQMMPLVVDIFNAAQRIARLMNFPADLVRTQKGALDALGEIAPLLQQGGVSQPGSAPRIPGSSNGPR